MTPALPCRLGKYLRDAIGASRSEVDALIAAGRVALQAPTTDPFVDPHTLVFDGDEVTVDGAVVTPTPGTMVVALHKPLGVVSTARDPHGHPCLAPWLDPLGPRAFPVGRLDADTSGLLLLTDDGDLAHLLLRPHHHVDKTYHLQVVGPVSAAQLAQLEAGVPMPGGLARARALEVLTTTAHVSVIALTIDEGRKHQVRRMARGVGLDLLALQRVRIGPVHLGDLAAGAQRHLDRTEYDALWHHCGGRAAVRSAQLRALHAQLAAAPDARLAAWLHTFDPRSPAQ